MTENEKLEHSKYGIASFVIGCITIFLVWQLLWGILGGVDSFYVYFSLFIVGIILGVVGMRQRDKNRIFAKLGFWINLIPTILTIGWLILAISGLFGS